MSGQKFPTWGDAELDRLYREMYEAEAAMDDCDIAEQSPRYKKAMAAADAFHKRCGEVDDRSFLVRKEDAR